MVAGVPRHPRVSLWPRTRSARSTDSGGWVSSHAVHEIGGHPQQKLAELGQLGVVCGGGGRIRHWPNRIVR